jgi:flavorubredoxin
LAFIGLSHVEADECGALNDWLEVAPRAVPVCSTVAAMVSIEDMADRPPRPLAEGERLDLGSRQVRWLDAPHVPHGWDCGYLFDERSGTLLCGDLFTQPGTGDPPLVESDILGPSEAMRAEMDYFAHATRTAELLDKLAATAPTTLACMHGSAWRGEGAALLRALAQALAQDTTPQRA